MYSQPQFYRFNEDSIKLVHQAIQKIKMHHQANVLDLCSGCGVIGIELALLSDVEVQVDFIEKQEQFLEHIQKNVETFIPHIKTHIKIGDFNEMTSVKKYDLILSNPPYFQQAQSRLSPDLRRRTCRSSPKDFEHDFYSFLSLNLAQNGKAIIVVRDDNHHWQQMCETFSPLRIDHIIELGKHRKVLFIHKR